MLDRDQVRDLLLPASPLSLPPPSTPPSLSSYMRDSVQQLEGSMLDKDQVLSPNPPLFL